MSSLPEPDEPPYRLDNASSATMILPDGRKLGYAQYGAPTGKPIIYLHGFPGSRIEGAGLDHAATKVGARIIAVDRPGLGWSSPHKDRTLLSHAKDIGALTNHLDLRHYGVLGISGGGPYALACAHSLPADRLSAVSIVCGLGSPDMGYRGMKWMNWAGWAFGQRMFPGLCRWWFSRDPTARLDLSDSERMSLMRADFENARSQMHPKDVAVLGNTEFMRMRLQTSREAFGQGMDGFSQDWRLLNSDFGFRIEDVRKDLKVQIWHGRLDGNVPLHHGKMVAARLGANALLKITDDTHASIWKEKKEEYLRELVDAIEK